MAFPVDVRIVGQALNSFGFTAYNTVEGLGLNTFGFLWPCDGIWGSAEEIVVTNWIPCTEDTPTVESCVD